MSNFVIGVTFLSLLNILGNAHTFWMPLLIWLYAALNSLFILFTLLLILGTKGVSLETSENNLFNGNRLRGSDNESDQPDPKRADQGFLRYRSGAPARCRPTFSQASGYRRSDGSRAGLVPTRTPATGRGQFFGIRTREPMTTKLGIVGFGKIARDQHVSAIAANADFELIAVASRNARHEGVDYYPDIDTLLTRRPDIEAVALCAPPQVRYAQAHKALAAGRHVLLEKPPGATLAEVHDLALQAKRAGRSLFASWHSRHAAAVEPARRWLNRRRIRRVDIQWQEDVRVFHPGQAWIWEPGGLGVFDPGINALSILSKILPEPPFITGATLSFPANRAAPIAAELTATTADEARIHAHFDWRHTGSPAWNIMVATDGPTLRVVNGGKQMFIDDELIIDEDDVEYAGLYAHFAELLRDGASDVDTAPLALVADSFLIGRHHTTDPFEE